MWIDAKKEVPSLGVVVVAISVGTHYPAAIATWETGHGFESIGFGDKRTLWNVTHWMALPKPPTANSGTESVQPTTAPAKNDGVGTGWNKY